MLFFKKLLKKFADEKIGEDNKRLEEENNKLKELTRNLELQLSIHKLRERVSRNKVEKGDP